jgi:stage II sporulation protein D
MTSIFIEGVPSYGVSSPKSDGMVDVGLIYGKNNQFPIGVGSDQGFVFGSVENGVYSTILDLSAYKSMMLYKDGFYEPSGRTLMTTGDYYLNGQVKGGYHIQIGSTFETYDQVLLEFTAIQALAPDAYLAYDNGWRVYTGQYLSQEEAYANLNIMSGTLSNYARIVTDPNPSSVIVSVNDKVLFSFDSTEKEFIFSTQIFEVGAIKYRGSFLVKRLPGSDFTFINRITLSEYLYGVLPKEMSGDWPIEALKAQAIAARNYVIMSGTKYAAYGFNVDNTTNSQVYGGYSAEKPNSNRAVDETNGYVLTSSGEIVSLFYHSHSGGITDNSEYVWNAALPYIKSTLDPYSIGYPNTDWSATINRSDIEQRLIIGGYSIGSLKTINIVERAPSGRVTKLEFVGSISKATLVKEKIRTVLGSAGIKSSLFSFDAGTAVTNVERVIAGLSGDTTTRPTNTTSNTPVSTNQSFAPLVMTSNAGVYGNYIDSNTLSIVEGGQTRTKIVDKSALRAATDIYANAPQSSVPYLYNSTESFDMSSGSVIFYGHGYGHGLGMSQFGAKKMAEMGKSFEEILSFYYKDTQLLKQ